MYKLQKISKSGWLDVKNKKSNELIRFKSKDDAIKFRLTVFGISAHQYIRVVRTKRKNKNLLDYS